MKKSIIAVVALMCAVSMLFAAPKAKNQRKLPADQLELVLSITRLQNQVTALLT